MTKSGLTVAFFGTSAFGLAALEALTRSRHRLAAVLSTPAKPQGRNLRLVPSPVRAWADAQGMAGCDFPDLDDSRARDFLRALKADVFVVIAYGKLLSPDTLSLPRLAPLNVHASLLPRYRGAAPIHWALLNGDTETGVTIMRMSAKLDAGDVLLQKRTAITDADDITTLEERLSRLGADALIEGLAAIETGKAVFTPQDPGAADYARKITKEDGRLAWAMPARALWRRVRALKRWPGCYFFYGQKRLIVREASVASTAPVAAAPGAVTAVSPAGIIVNTGDGALALTRLQLEGRKALEADEFLKGFPIPVGAVLD